VKETENENIVLTAKQERFCYEYCIDFNATHAAIRAGYSVKTAGVIGNENLKKPYLQTKIKQMQDNLAETAGISALRIINEHKKIAFTDAGKLRDGWMKLKDFESLTNEEKASIQEVSTKETKTTFKGQVTSETWVKIKLYDKQKSLDSISSILGFNAPVKSLVDLNIPSLPSITIKSRNATD
jgi:phage terminase small subunit